MIAMFLAMLESEEDRKQFLKLHSAYEIKMMRIAVSILQSHAWAEDAVQQSWLQIIQHFEEVRKIPWDRVGGYVAVVVKNISLTFLRREWRRVDFPENWDIPLSETAAFDAPNRIVEIIRAMPEQYRQILEMKFVLEYANREIAELLKMNEGTGASRISRERKLLAEKLKEAGYDDE